MKKAAKKGPEKGSLEEAIRGSVLGPICEAAEGAGALLKAVSALPNIADTAALRRDLDSICGTLRAAELLTDGAVMNAEMLEALGEEG